MAMITKEQALSELHSTAINLLGKYKKSEETVIWEYSGSINEEIEKLDRECNLIAKRLDYLLEVLAGDE